MNIASSLNQLLKGAKDYRDKNDRMWKQQYEWFLGDQELEDAMPGEISTVSNFLFSQIMQIIPILCARIPRVRAKSIDRRMFQQGDELTRQFEIIFKQNQMHRIVVEWVTNGLIFNRSFIKATWCPKKRGGRGDIKLDVPDTRHIFIEPGVMRLDNMSYVFEARPVNKLAMYRMFPDRRRDIDGLFAKAKQKDESAPSYAKEVGSYRHASPPAGPVDTSTATYVETVARDQSEDLPEIEFVDAWFQDERTIGDLKKIFPDLKTKIPDEEAAFPTGRLVQFSGGVVFSDKPNPFPSYPFVDYMNIFLPGEPWSMNDLEQPMPLQEQYNIRQNQIYQILNFHACPWKFYDLTSGLDPDELTNSPIDWHGCSDVNGIRIFDPPPIHAATFDSLLKLQRDIETMFGVPEVTRGLVPGQIRSGFAVEQLQEAAQVRLQLKTQFIETAVMELARYMTRMIGTFYIPGVHYPDTIDLRGVNPDDFEYDIKAGTNAPSSRFAEQQMVLQLHAGGTVDDEYLVDYVDLPDKTSLKERMGGVWNAKRERMLQIAAPPGR